MQNRLGRLFLAAGGLLLCGLLAVAVFLYLDYATGRAMPTIPLVSITGTYPEGTATTHQSVIVFGKASDPDGIAEVQLWVNGQMVASQTNVHQLSNRPFDVSQAWVPTGAANYLVVLRAVDRKGFAGQSEPIMVEALERSYTHEVGPGETIESIAQEFGTTPEDISTRNPGLGSQPAPGTSIDVPAAPAGDGAGAEGGTPPGDGAGEPPHVDPPPVPTPPSGDETPAEPAPRAWWAFLPLPENFICVLRPDFCSPAAADDDPATPAVEVGAALTGDCQVIVGWTDTSKYEMGFRIYRVSPRPFHYDRVALLRASPGNSARLSFVDENPPNGRYFYLVAAYDSNGEYWSAPTESVTVACHPPEVADGLWLEIEALEMTVRDPYDRLYCYASLAGSPYERIPGYGQFIEMESGAWDIAAHFSGDNKRAIMVSPGTPVEIVVECMGWQGEALTNLGRFTRSHPPEEWDGRHLTAGPPDGSFNVTYRIQPLTETEGEVSSGTWALTDSSIPPPYNLRTALDYRWTPPGADPEVGTVAERSEPGLAWDYTVEAGRPRPPVDFRVYYQTEAGGEPVLYYRTHSGTNLTAPQVFDQCQETLLYTVTAVIGFTRSGEIIESPPSAAVEVPARCIKLEITLATLTIKTNTFGYPYDGEFEPLFHNCFDDCGNEVELFGWMDFNGKVIRWNSREEGGFGEVILQPGPRSYRIRDGTSIAWDHQYLDSGHGYGLGQNALSIPITEGSDLKIDFRFYDDDPVSDDDLFCYPPHGPGEEPFVLEARSRDEWLAFDQDVVMDFANGFPCVLAFRVRGVP